MPRALFFALLLSSIACRSLPPLTVATDLGPITGTSSAATRVFLGVPYAAPPLGPLRFRPPAEPSAWTAPLDASRLGTPCIQKDGPPRAASSEDCLKLNVWTVAREGEKRPVMVWIHGGGFVGGSGGDELYNGARLSSRTGHVVVTLNYRVGPLGFLSHPALAAELGREASPSIGLLDQRAALLWVKRNIAAFGGDPGNVTIFGESAGAWSVCSHLASPGSHGLFARAIMQSGACSNAIYFSAQEAVAQGELFARTAGCEGPDVLACLRGLDARKIHEVLPTKRGMLLEPGVWWGPVVDGVELPKLPLTAIRDGDFARVPLLLGANRDEGIIHTISFETVSTEEVDGFVRSTFGERAAAAYGPAYQRATPKLSLDDVVTDGVFVCEARRIARAASGHGAPAYLYHFTRALEDPRVNKLGATHSVELFFMWNNHDFGYGIAPSELPLAHLMMDAWGRFAASGDPNGPELVWPRYTRTGDEHLQLDMQPKAGAHLKKELCDLWDSWQEDQVAQE